MNSSNNNNNEPENESVAEHDPWSISELSELAHIRDDDDEISISSIIDVDDDSLNYSEDTIENIIEDTIEDTNSELNTATIDIYTNTDTDIGTDIGIGTDINHSQIYIFNKISDLTDHYIQMESNIRSLNNRVELFQVSAGYNEYHINHLYDSLVSAKSEIEYLHQVLNRKNDEIAELRREFTTIKRRIEK